ncbi:MAG TPA: V-type ATP synthase subunit D [Myxococcales bacterium]|nr:V-type ATP synthase subunit D [Myxococcales bacterium]
MSERAAPTRMNLLRARRQLDRVMRGAELLRKRREALVAELFRTARPAIDARAAVDRQARRAYAALLDALAVHGKDGLRPMGWPQREIALEIEDSTVWGVPAAHIAETPPVRRTPEARGLAPGAQGPAAGITAEEFESLLEMLLAAAPREFLLQRLAEALARTSRQVNTIEQRLAPRLRADIAGIGRVLEEREREERLRLRWLLERRSSRASGPGS